MSPAQVSTGTSQSPPRPRSIRMRLRQLAGGPPGVLGAGPVGLVDRDDVGDLEDAALDALQRVAGAGEGEEEERVDHLGDRDLRLPDADGLDEDDVVAGRLHDDHRLAGGLRDPAERARPSARAG